MPPTRPLTTGPGPAIFGNDPWQVASPATSALHQLLSAEERTRLATIASIVRFKRGEAIYVDGAPADAVFNIIAGTVKTHKKLPDGVAHITAFLFPGDVFGLSEGGLYESSASAVEPVTAYRLPISALRSRLKQDATLEFHVICKLCHELRTTQRHAFLLAERRALSKVAMFLQMIELQQNLRGNGTDDIVLAMSRSDIGDYVGMSLAAVSRAFRTLAARGIIETRQRHHVKIVDRAQFEQLAGRSG